MTTCFSRFGSGFRRPTHCRPLLLLTAAAVCLLLLPFSLNAHIHALNYDRKNGISRVIVSTDAPVADYRLHQDKTGKVLVLTLSGLGVSSELPVRYQVEDSYFHTLKLASAKDEATVQVELRQELEQVYFRVAPRESGHGLELHFSPPGGGISDYVPGETLQTMEDIDLFEGAYTMIISLLVVLALFAVVVWFMRRLSGRQVLLETNDIRVISRTPIGNKKNLVVVEVFEETLLIGEWDDGLCFMKTIENEKTLSRIRLHDKKVHANFSSYLKRAVTRNSVSGLTHSIRSRMDNLRSEQRDEKNP